MWHHEHYFEQIAENETKMKDIVNFKMPFGILGDLFVGKLVRNKVKRVF